MNLKLKRTPGIFLIGFMGSGKSTVGRMLAEEIGWRFADLDDDIEHAHHRTVSDIFKPPTVPANDVALQNQRAVWTHTFGLGMRFKIPVGGEFGIDYARMMNPPRFLIPQATGPNAIYQLRQDQLHFRFSQSF